MSSPAPNRSLGAVQRKILTALKNVLLNVTELSTQVGRPPCAVAVAIEALEARGLIEQSQWSDRWRITETGLATVKQIQARAA